MAEPLVSQTLIAALRAGDEALDRGQRGPSIEIGLLAQAGLLEAPLPIELGGAGWGTSPAGAVPLLDSLMKLGGASLPIARLYEGHVNAVKLVTVFGSDQQQAQASVLIQQGILMGVWGADGETPVEIVKSGDAKILAGAKAFASGVGDIGMAIVTARLDNALMMVLVEAQATGRCHPQSWDVAAMVGSRSGQFDCDGLPANADNMLGPPDALFLEPDFHGGLWRLCACYAGALERIAQLVAELVASRGKIAAEPMRGRIGQIAIEAQTARLWAIKACHAIEGGDVSSADAISAALFAREAIEQAAGRALQIAERVAGTGMFRRGSALGRLARDLRFYLRQADLDGKLSLATEYWLAGRSGA